MSTKQKIRSEDLGKLIFFIFIQLATCMFLLVGVIPGIILLVTYWLSTRDRNESILANAINIVYAYTIVIVFITIGFQIYAIYTGEDILIPKPLLIPLTLFIAFIYILIVKNFYHVPIKNYIHDLKKASPNEKEVSNFILSNNGSISEELLRWKELKDSGVISEEEFNQMKNKIMKN